MKATVELKILLNVTGDNLKLVRHVSKDMLKSFKGIEIGGGGIDGLYHAKTKMGRIETIEYKNKNKEERKIFCTDV